MYVGENNFVLDREHFSAVLQTIRNPIDVCAIHLQSGHEKHLKNEQHFLKVHLAIFSCGDTISTADELFVLGVA